MNKKTLLASAVMLALLSGCTDKTAAEHYQQAQSYLAQKNVSAAVIELKSAIQQEPTNADYRLTLGKIYLANGDSFAAEKELSRAIDNGISIDTALLPWIRSLYLSSQFEKILSYSNNNLTENQQHYLKTYQALAELELGDADAAMQLFDNLSNVSDKMLLNFAQANLALHSKQLETAIELLGSIEKSSLIYPEAIYLQAYIEMARNNTQQAIVLFQQYLELTPRSLKATLLLAQSQVKEKLYADAEKNLQFLLKVLPDQPATNYLKALVELEKKNYVLAKEHAEKAINNGYQTPQARIIAAIASINQNLESQALHHLSAVKNHLHIYPPAQKLYTMLQLRAGESVEAQSMLMDMTTSEHDLQLVSATSFELVKQGNTEAARELLAKYEQQFTLDAQSMTSMGAVKMEIPGQELAALRDLEQALLLDPTSDKTRLVLAGSYLRLKQYDKARKIADELTSNADTVLVGHNLNAFISLLEKDTERAKLELKAAEKLQADNPFTLLMQASIAADEQDYKTASRLLELCIEKYPDYRPALKQYFYVKSLQNESHIATKKAEELLGKANNDHALRSQLAQFHYVEKNYQKAATLLTESIKQNVALSSQDWLLLINALYLTGDRTQAQHYSQQWHTKYPNDVYAIVTYAKALAQQRDMARSLQVLNAAGHENAGHKALLAMKILVLAELKQYSEALALFESIPKDLALSAEMLMHKGRLLQLNGQISPALDTLLDSYQLQPSTMTTMLITNIYATDRSHKQAIQFLEQHFTKHGKEQPLRVYYANLMIDADNEKAQQLYADLLTEDPDNIILLNNYAWLLGEANKLHQANEYAQKALDKAPDNPDVLDTYGKILLKMNNGKDAIDYFERSLQIRPEQTAVMLNYAEALILTGSKEKAKQLLQTIKSEQHIEVERKKELLKRAEI